MSNNSESLEGLNVKYNNENFFFVCLKLRFEFLHIKIENKKKQICHQTSDRNEKLKFFSSSSFRNINEIQSFFVMSESKKIMNQSRKGKMPLV